MSHILRSFVMAAVLAAFPLVACAGQTCGATLTRLNSRYTVLVDDSQVQDTLTGLIWLRCSLGQTWNGSTCVGTPKTYSWYDAVNQQVVVSSTVFRLPTYTELSSLVESACQNPAINAVVFPGTPVGLSWSSTPNDHVQMNAEFVNFFAANCHSDGYKPNHFYVRLVSGTALPWSGPKTRLTVPTSDQKAGVPVSLSGEGTTDDAAVICIYQWDFGDGQTVGSDGPAVQHVYASPGTYTVTLNPRDNNRFDNPVRKQINIVQ